MRCFSEITRAKIYGLPEIRTLEGKSINEAIKAEAEMVGTRLDKHSAQEMRDHLFGLAEYRSKDAL